MSISTVFAEQIYFHEVIIITEWLKKKKTDPAEIINYENGIMNWSD